MKKIAFTCLVLILLSGNAIAGTLTIYNYCDMCPIISVVVTVPAFQSEPAYNEEDTLNGYGDSVSFSAPRSGNYRIQAACIGGAGLVWDFITYHGGQLGETVDKSLVCETRAGCLVKEIYGEGSEEVAKLRYLRGNVLNQTPTGRELIKLYYQLSPAIVKAMEKDEEFKEDVKEMINRILPLIAEE